MLAAIARWLQPCAAITLVACGAQATHEVANTSPHYAGSCALAGIDEVPAPAEQQGDSLALVVRHRFGGGTPSGEQPVVVRSELARTRENDPQLQLEGHSTVVCNPDSEATPIEVPTSEEGVP
jgi:hypothetical protein